MKSKRPQDTRRALQRVLRYMGAYKWTMAVVAVLVVVSAGANIMGTYLFKPLINRYILPGDMKGLAGALVLMGGMYLLGAAATYGYSQLMVHVAQKIVGRIRSDLFRCTQKLPLTYFDSHTHGDLMSHFTNDVDTLQEALNNSFAMIIQSFYSRWNHFYDDGAQCTALDDCCSVFGLHVLFDPPKRKEKPPLFPRTAGRTCRFEWFH